jgi:hypothetical protein
MSGDEVRHQISPHMLTFARETLKVIVRNNVSNINSIVVEVLKTEANNKCGWFVHHRPCEIPVPNCAFDLWGLFSQSFQFPVSFPFSCFVVPESNFNLLIQLARGTGSDSSFCSSSRGYYTEVALQKLIEQSTIIMINYESATDPLSKRNR